MFGRNARYTRRILSKHTSDRRIPRRHCRVSEHTPAEPEVTFDELWNKIGKDHAEDEKEKVCLIFERR